MALKYPLSRYDEAGRMKPPALFYVFVLFVCRGLFILVVALSMGDDSERLLRIFYPQPYQFYLALLPIIPALFALIVVSKRTLLWKNQNYRWFNLVPKFAILALIIDVVVQFYILKQVNFQYSATLGLSIIISLAGLSYFLRSTYLKYLVSDWVAPK